MNAREPPSKCCVLFVARRPIAHLLRKDTTGLRARRDDSVARELSGPIPPWPPEHRPGPTSPAPQKLYGCLLDQVLARSLLEMDAVPPSSAVSLPRTVLDRGPWGNPPPHPARNG